MRIFTTKRVAILISSLLSLITGIALYLYSLLNAGGYNWLYILLWILISFATTYISTYTAFNYFIINKINPLFKTINSLKDPANASIESIEEGELLKKIDSNIVEWAKSKVREIAALKANEKFRKEFLGNVSHELKTPLFNIQGYILTLLEGGLDDDKINVKYLQRTEKNINRLISIVHDLETISRLESGDQKLHKDNFDIVQLCQDVFEMQEIRANRKNIKLLLNHNHSKKSIVYADKKSISDVLNNLIINSIIYGKENGKTKVIIDNLKDLVKVRICDNGIGIEVKYINRIFERFFRVDKSRSKLQGGTGLGLSIVKHIIEAHNQKIWVNSIFGKETCFSFTLEKRKRNG